MTRDDSFWLQLHDEVKALRVRSTLCGGEGCPIRGTGVCVARVVPEDSKVPGLTVNKVQCLGCRRTWKEVA